MNLSALAGIGAGLQAFGNSWDASNKQKLAEQLEREREERAEARAIAKEERDAKRLENTVAETRAEQDEDGVWWMRGYNAAGTPKGEPRLATQGEIQSASMQQGKDKASLDKLISDAELAKFKATRAPLEAGQSDQLFEQKLRAGEADIGATNAQADYYRSGSSKYRTPLDSDASISGDYNPESDIQEVAKQIFDTVYGNASQSKDFDRASIMNDILVDVQTAVDAGQGDVLGKATRLYQDRLKNKPKVKSNIRAANL